jgi:uncharacterized protein (DUF924 family)
MKNYYPNLKPFTSDQDREAAAINGRKGGIASGIKRAHMANLRLFAYCYMEQSEKLEQAKKRKRKLQRAKRKKALEAMIKP